MTTEETRENLNMKFLELRDSRVSKPDIWICEQNNSKHKIWPTNWILSSNGINIVIDKPNDIAIYSKMANDNLIESKALFFEKIYPLTNRFTMCSLIMEEQKLFYDYFGKIISSIIFSYTALETFANIFIPDDYTVTKTENSGVVKIWNKVAIERTYPLKDKFKEILSDVFKTGSPSKEKWWNNFISLEKIRNEIVHSKPSQSEERYSAFLNKAIFEVVDSHNNVINFYGKFIDSSEKLSLINEFPYGFHYDRVMHCDVEEDEFDEIVTEIGNVKFDN